MSMPQRVRRWPVLLAVLAGRAGDGGAATRAGGRGNWCDRL